MAYIFIVFCHIEALSGIAAFGAVLALLIGAGRNRAAMLARVAAALAGFAVYGLLARFGFGAGDYLAWLVRPAPWGEVLALLAASVLVGALAAPATLLASRGEAARRTSAALVALLALIYTDGYLALWRMSLAESLLALLPFVLFTTGAVAAGLLSLVRPSRRG